MLSLRLSLRLRLPLRLRLSLSINTNPNTNQAQAEYFSLRIQVATTNTVSYRATIMLGNRHGCLGCGEGGGVYLRKATHRALTHNECSQITSFSGL